MRCGHGQLHSWYKCESELCEGSCLSPPISSEQWSWRTNAESAGSYSTCSQYCIQQDGYIFSSGIGPCFIHKGWSHGGGRHHLALLMWICQVCTHYVIHYFDFHFPPTVYTNSLNLKNVKFFSYHARQWKDFSLVPPQLFLTVMNKFLHLAKGGNTQCLFRLLWLCIVLVWPIHPPRSPLQARPGSGSCVCYMNPFLYEYASCLILETVWGLFPATSHLKLVFFSWLSWRWEKKEYLFFFLSTDIIGWGEKTVKTMTCL